MIKIQKELFAMRDLVYREFHGKLMPTVDADKIIGIRIPVLRKFAKEFSKRDDVEIFLKTLPHIYYEENNLHAFVIEQETDFDKAIALTEEFLPHIDNWATCDMFFPKCFGKNKEKILVCVRKWIESKHTYTVRYGIGVLMRIFLDDEFKGEYMQYVASIKSSEYYVNMMIAWYFSTALAKQYDTAIKYIEQGKLSKWLHNKAIQKAIESRRVPEEKKKYLRILKIK